MKFKAAAIGSAQSNGDFEDKLRVQPNFTVQFRTRNHARLIDARGEPFRNAPIELREFLSPTKHGLSTTVMTDPDGIFQIDAVKPGNYRLLA
jgi:hypothetical protein